MDTRQLLGVDHRQALQFFFEKLRDVSGPDQAPQAELLYNASILAHFATTSRHAFTTFPAAPVGLDEVLDVFVLDRSEHADPDILEAAASICLVLTGFFADQQRHRHNVDWFASLGAGFYDRAAHHGRDVARIRMMEAMADHFDYWRGRQRRLARELRDEPRLLFGGLPPVPGIH
ncbi:MAG: hypothetical protein R2752_23030 [Vicinamibacterales bacterium]